MPADSRRGRWILWFLEFQVVVSHLMWVLRPKTGFSRTAGSPGYRGAASPASLLGLLSCALVTDNFPFNFGDATGPNIAWRLK